MSSQSAVISIVVTLSASFIQSAELTTEVECGPKDVKVVKHSDSRFSLAFPSGGRDKVGWFVFKLSGIDTRKEVQIDLSGIPIKKWKSLNPVYCETDDLAQHDSYLSRPTTGTVVARNGADIPLSAQSWRYIVNVVIDEASSQLSFRQRFGAKTVFIAMRPPYTPTFHASYMELLSKHGGIKVHHLGKSEKGNALHAVQIGGSNLRSPCVLVYAREHADEHDGSWVAQGLVEYLLTNERSAAELRRNVTFLVIPLLDPDGAMTSDYENITKSFHLNKQSRTSNAIAGFLMQWVDSGARLDLVINLHNVESHESSHLACAIMEPENRRYWACAALHRRVLEGARQHGFDCADKPWTTGYMSDRLGGFCERYYGALHMLYECNSQAPNRHLSIHELRMMGAVLGDSAGRFLGSQEGQRLLANISRRRTYRQNLVARYSDLEILNGKSPFETERLYVDLPAVEQFWKEAGETPSWLKLVKEKKLHK